MLMNTSGDQWVWGAHEGDAMLTDEQAESRRFAHELNVMIKERGFAGKAYPSK